jgi:hypothetical protein
MTAWRRWVIGATAFTTRRERGCSHEHNGGILVAAPARDQRGVPWSLDQAPAAVLGRVHLPLQPPRRYGARDVRQLLWVDSEGEAGRGFFVAVLRSGASKSSRVGMGISRPLRVRCAGSSGRTSGFRLVGILALDSRRIAAILRIESPECADQSFPIRELTPRIPWVLFTFSIAGFGCHTLNLMGTDFLK